MPVPDDPLNDEGRLIAQLGRRRIFPLLIGTILSHVGLIGDLKIAPQPNLKVISNSLTAMRIVLS